MDVVVGVTDQALLRRIAQSLDELPPVRRAWVAAACSLLGLGWAPGGVLRARYEALLWLYDPPDQREQMAREQSSCAIAWEAEARAMRVDDERLYRPIGPRTVGHEDPSTPGRDWGLVTLGIEVAREHGALRELGPSLVLEPGDGVVLTGPDHVLTVALVEGDIEHGVDGGQPGVELRSRRIIHAGGEVWLGDIEAGVRADGRPAKGRRISYVIDPERLRYR